ncbi:MAG: hypothetical protein ACRC7O_13355, partial [Fimbriiglobus sp.]
MPWDTDSPRPARRPRRRGDWTGLLLAVLIGFALGGLLLRTLNPPDRFRVDTVDADAQPRPVVAATGPDFEEQQAMAVFAGAKNSV